MSRIVDQIHIENFKSLKEVSLNDCRTYNLLLGRPNVGKSNLLEALSIFSIPYLQPEKRELGDVLRYQHDISELFSDGNVSCPITVQAGDYRASLEVVEGRKLNWMGGQAEKEETLILSGGKIANRKVSDNMYLPFKRYIFRKLDKFSNVDMPFLLPVAGENIMQAIQGNDKLVKEIAGMAAEYGLQLLFDTSTREIKFQKKLDENTVFSIPFFSISDTLQRLMFYKTAICSNQNSVVLLEEIEAHAYPPFISKITGCILENAGNQYFITTHSPYVLNDFLERQEGDLAIYLVDLDEGCTTVRRLSEAEVEEVYNDGIDLFFNSEIFSK